MAELTIRDAADHTGLSTHTLRYYEELGLVGPVARNDAGHRRYSACDLDRVDFVQCLLATGMRLDGIRDFVELGEAPTSLPERQRLLTEQRDRLDAEIARLQAHRRHLDEKLAHYEASASVAPASA
jgi:DNA-binding transcriptional MerR regulator